jgi:hypothetical protein
MKYIQTVITMVVGVVLALGSSAVAQSVRPCVVTVVRIQGQARYSLGDNAWHPLVVGKILRSGAIIQSAVNSKVDIVLSGDPVAMPQAAPSPDTISFAPDANVRGLVSYKPMVQQNVIRMFGNTVLAVDKLTVSDTGVDTVSDTELDLRAGGIFLNVKKMSATSQFIIKIPDGVAGIRGSIVGVQLDPAGHLIYFATYSGSAVLSYIPTNGGAPNTDVLNGPSEFTPMGGVKPLDPGLKLTFESLSASVPTLYMLLSGNISTPDAFKFVNYNSGVICSSNKPSLYIH